jgi:monoamine oxidase
LLADEEIIERAIAALGRQFGLRQRDARKTVIASWLHNWENDPYSRGAYSYMTVGGNEAPAKLARPIKGTLFFAGEASDSDGRTGTVHGALATGARATKQLLRAL